MRDRVYLVSMTVAFAALFVVVAAIVGIRRFGSIPASLDYLSGERLLMSRDEVSIGETHRGDNLIVSMTVVNASTKPVRILGSSRSCSCMSETDLPFTLGPGEKRSLPLSVRITGKPRRFDESVEIYSDNPSRSRLTFRVTGSVVTRSPIPMQHSVDDLQ